MEPTLIVGPAVLTSRMLILADWKTNPDEVVAACVNRIEAQHASVDLVVPAALHGIDWVGDPYANAACAKQTLDKLTELLQAAGIEVASATVGDHDPVAAALDATLAQPPERILVCGLTRRIKLFDLGHRVSRATRYPVVSVPVPPVNRSRRGWRRLRSGECAKAQRPRPFSGRSSLTPISH